ncbi:MAG: glycosyltransferase [Planctomycetota bacterium]
MSRPVSVCHGPRNIGGMAGVLARGQRELGADAESICHTTGRYDYHADVVLGTPGGDQRSPWQAAMDRTPSFGVFQFYFGESLRGNGLEDVKQLAQSGKKVFFYFCGCDIRDSKATIAKYRYSACERCWPVLCSRNRETALDVARRFADGSFVSTPDLLEFVEGSTLMLQPVDIEMLERIKAKRGTEPPPGEPGIDRPMRIAHAPTNRQMKGSAFIEEAVRELQRDGFNCELHLHEGLSHEEAIAACTSCDLCVDQLLFGSYGLYSVEMMALGLPVVCYLRPDVREHYPTDCPVLNANPRTITETLRRLISDRDERASAAARGLDYVRERHDHRVIAGLMLRAYGLEPTPRAKPLASSAPTRVEVTA